ncbi:MAG: glycosyltransferase, partial [Bdellovibrionota bacterium]
SILFYPSKSPETCCITALEAQAAGCVVLSSHFGALPETVNDAGLLIRGTPGSPEYLNSYLAAADILLSDDQLLERLSNRGKERIAEHYHWDHVAERFEAVLDKLVF